MEPAEKGGPAVRKKGRGKSPFTVMIMGNVGKVRSFNIAPRFLFWAAAFFLVYVPSSLFLIQRYFDLRQTSRLQSERVTLLEREVAQNEKLLLQSKERITLLEDYVGSLEGPQERRADVARKDEPSRGAEAADSKKGGKRQDPAGETSTILDIKDLTVRKEGSRLVVDFKLINTQSGDSPIGGYIHVIAKGRNPNPPQEWAYPKQKLQNGLPSDFRRGQVFMIQRYKQFQGRLQVGTPTEPPSAVKVLAYSQSGDLLLDKEIEVSDGA